MNLSLIGCGLIGGSLALALREIGAVVTGWDRDPAHLERARARGIVDAVATDPESAAAAGDIVFLAVPVRGLAELAGRCAQGARPGTILTDVGSTKAGVVRACEAAVAGRARFVGGHPLAGTERAGPDAADGRLFRGRKVLLTPTAATDRDALAVVAGLWRAAGATVAEMDPDEHDRKLAAVSHLPHVVAYALAGALADDGGLVGLAGGGFTDTTRIASTPPAMWLDVFLENREAVLAWVDRFAAELTGWREAIAAGDVAAMDALIAAARAGRERILGR